MKKSILFSVLLMIAILAVAQEQLTPKGGVGLEVVTSVQFQEIHQSMSQGQRNSFLMQLPEADEKTAVSVWKEVMKEYKGKAKKKGGEYITETEGMKALGEGLISVYAKFDDQEISVWFERDGQFISTSSNPSSYAFVQELLNDYSFNLQKEMALQNVETQEKQLKDLEKDLSKLEKENQRYHDIIEKAKAAIAEAEQGIVTNESDQTKKKSEIESQKVEVQTAQERHSSITKYKGKQ